MRRIAVQVVLLLLFFVRTAFAQDVVTLDGEPFTKKFVGRPANGGKVIEFVRASETFDKWTKLVGYYYQPFPRFGNDPKKIAAGMAQAVKAANPQAQFRVVVNEQSNEAIIDFLTWPADGKYMEFNVFRYVKSADGNAVVSLQLAYRFTEGSSDAVKNLKKVRDAWINQAASFDMRQVHAALVR